MSEYYVTHVSYSLPLILTVSTISKRSVNKVLLAYIMLNILKCITQLRYSIFATCTELKLNKSLLTRDYRSFNRKTTQEGTNTVFR